jgi:hypothetical protein
VEFEVRKFGGHSKPWTPFCPNTALTGDDNSMAMMITMMSDPKYFDFIRTSFVENKLLLL